MYSDGFGRQRSEGILSLEIRGFSVADTDLEKEGTQAIINMKIYKLTYFCMIFLKDRNGRGAGLHTPPL